VTDHDFIVRDALAEDLPEASRLAAELIRVHHGFDPDRFAILAENLERGYEWYFRRRLEEGGAVILLALSGEAIAGYAYAELEGQSWTDLIGPHGKVHDLFVDPAFRGRGVGEALMREALRRLIDRGAPRILLDTAWSNGAARRLFERIGYRPTMVEMTFTPEPPPPPP
jgi:ribosomal protein S18 acetylase RimI-like enzyme